MLEKISSMNQFLWGFPMLFLLMGTHIYFTFRLNFIQKYTFKAIKWSVSSDKTKTSEGDMSSFASLATTLAATLGTGNIIGVSTAVALGGPGAIFWCWLTGIFGMATSYAECYLGIKYRKKASDGSYLGGPMYVIHEALHSKTLAAIFCICTILASYGVGCSTQANSITETTSSLWNMNPYIVGFVTALLIGFAIIGGIKTISKICTKLVPAMGFIYILGCFIILILNYNFISEAIVLIVKSAFIPSAAIGGVVGGTIKTAARYGVSRGLFTNEAGLGSAPMAAAAAKSKNPVKQALVSMTATFWDTVVMCAITGLVIVTNLLSSPGTTTGCNSAELTTAAFSKIPVLGPWLLGISLIAFAIATLLGWNYFGEKATLYLFGPRGINTYRVGYIVMIFIGAVMSLDLVWELSDFINIFMMLPNICALIILRREIPKKL